MTAFLTSKGRSEGGGVTRIAAHRVLGFISETSCAFDLASIAGQKAGIDAAAETAGIAVEAYLVEMSKRNPGELWTPAVKDLLLQARTGGLEALVLDHVDRLASDHDAALLVAVTFVERGVRVIEAATSGCHGSGPLDLKRVGPVTRSRAVCSFVEAGLIASERTHGYDAELIGVTAQALKHAP